MSKMFKKMMKSKGQPKIEEIEEDSDYDEEEMDSM